ncbi:RagB/SusD family nutrient uptake outer membrane protein [uncultured Capnocytophaga sp.]|uniref:RagB/SusD family nutrient uptake outer membrane protein n=1 Tax=uncultured Capnocytophaga sp. TaxID=159273 RepID=UPI00262C4B4E|nr:RagB/SusD family nutrient uptake outer membrane protein [uncultured Capnocytophaga sp.]
MKKIIYTSLFLTGGLLLTSCRKDFTETQFFQSKQAEPLKTVEEASSFVNGTYAQMREKEYLGSYYLAYGEVRSDEVYNNMDVGRFRGESLYTMDANDGDARDTWTKIYGVIANINNVINAPDNLSSQKAGGGAANPSEVKAIKAQAYAIRGMAFFDLLRLYGQKYTGGTLGVPLPLEYNALATTTRPTIEQTEAQIEADFDKAMQLFQDVASAQRTTLAGLVNTTDKTKLSPMAVKAYQSRFYLYKGDWDKVATLSEEIINSGRYEVVPAADLAASFVKANANNSVFELAVGVKGSLGSEGFGYLFNSGGYATLLPTNYALSLFENSDIRKSLFVGNSNDGYFLDGKFSDLQSQSNVKLVRYEEVLLNAAEASLNKGDQATALTYYNQLRAQRGFTAAATSLTMEELKKERLRELLGEGFRYWDLLRWGDTVPYYDRTGATDPANNRAVPNKVFAFPIPQAERNSEYSNVPQNDGY